MRPRVPTSPPSADRLRALGCIIIVPPHGATCRNGAVSGPCWALLDLAYRSRAIAGLMILVAADAILCGLVARFCGSSVTRTQDELMWVSYIHHLETESRSAFLTCFGWATKDIHRRCVCVCADQAIPHHISINAALRVSLSPSSSSQHI